jgi:high affinity sulfate transporter 1
MTLEQYVPGLKTFQSYKREWLSDDLLAGLSVAAVALPVGIAYAQLAGFSPVIGIYSAILPLIAYALFGTSHQLIVNPDAAACAIIASTVAPLAAGNYERYLDLAITLTLLTGVLCIIGGFVRLGVIANFLSRPILTGYLNGIALSIIVGQLGKLLGFNVESMGFFRTLANVFSRVDETHAATALLGISLFVLLILMKRLVPRIPGPLIASIAGIAAVYFLALPDRGVAIIGHVPAGLPTPRIPSVNTSDISPLLFGAGGIMLVSFCSMMTTARGFAAKNGYSIDANRDMTALGFCDLASGISSGFAVSGADSRTAVADSSGAKSQLTGVIAAVVITLVLLFFTGPLGYVPIAALAAILISSAIGLLDFSSLLHHYRLSKTEFVQAMAAMLGVMTIGVLPGVIIAVALALLNLIRHASRPPDAVLGMAEGKSGYYAQSIEDGGQSIPGLLIYRFNVGLIFFNADRFKERIHAFIESADTKPEWLLFDAGSSPMLDVTGVDALSSLQTELADRGIVLALARPVGLFRKMFVASGIDERIGSELVFHTVHSAVEAFLKAQNSNGKSPIKSELLTL